ncbi:MAG: hypothetical protein MJ228_01475 [Bacilli bacterium]|nr:hypothetical protein [Bacilli bacterium]
MKKITSIALLSLSLILASCGTPANNSSAPVDSASDTSALSSSETSAPGASSSNIEKTRAEKLKDLFTTMMTTGNATFADLEYGLTDYYFGGDAGMLTINDNAVSQGKTPVGYGVAKVAGYGLIEYLYNNDTAGVDTTSITCVSPNANIKFTDYNNKISILGECGLAATFTESTRTHTFSTSNADFVNSLLDLYGLGEAIDLFPTVKAAVKFDDETSNLSISLSLSGSETYKDQSFSGIAISGVGTTANAKVASYLATKPTPVKPTAWNADVTAYLTSLGMGNLPLPAGITNAASLGNGSSSMIFQDLGSGNITSAYGTVLTGLGYTYDAQNSGTESGVTYAFYAKTISNTVGLVAGKTAYVALAFQAPTAETRQMYPNGVFTMLAFVEEDEIVNVEIDAATLNNHLANFKRDWDRTTNVYPTINFGTNCTKLTYTDATVEFEEQMNQYYGQMLGIDIDIFTVDLYAEVKAYYATEAEATAFVTALGQALVAAGFVANANSAGVWNLTDSATTNPSSYQAMVSAEPYMGSDSNNPSYQGYALISFSYLTMNL